MEHMHERASQEQDVREEPEQVGPVFGQQEKQRDRQKTGQYPPGSACHSFAACATA
jgi:hypothetical protein